MEVINSLKNLFENVSHFYLVEPSFFDSMKELSTLTQFHYEINVLFVSVVLVEFDNVGMIEAFEKRNFPQHPFNVFLVNRIFFK
jgi:hypothetical protein